MRVLYLSSQFPGYGGAATEAYETIKWLRKIGWDVVGCFVEHCGGCERSPNLPLPQDCAWYDPDNIGNVLGIKKCKKGAQIPFGEHWDVVVGKNYEAPMVCGGVTGAPVVFLTSGIDYISWLGVPASETNVKPPPDGVDLKAFRASYKTIVHSTLDMEVYQRLYPEDAQNKIHPKIIYTPDIAARIIEDDDKPYGKRKYDYCFSASSWGRTMKNAELMRECCRKLDGEIVVCGLHFEPESPNVYTPGILPHAEMIRIMHDSRVVVIPSWYDPSPNLYAEAILSGCNVVVSRNVDNIDEHPPDLVAPGLESDQFVATVKHAGRMKKQKQYRRISAAHSAIELQNALEEIIVQFRSERKPQAKVITLSAAEPKAPPAPTPTHDYKKLITLLHCQSCGGGLRDNGGYYAGCTRCNQTYPIKDGVVDFVDGDKYTGSFSEQWAKHRKTQVDSAGFKSGYPKEVSSSVNFTRKTKLDLEELRGKIVLDAGSGPGRYAEVAAREAAGLICVDLSDAVFHCAELLKGQGFTNTLCVHADLASLPVIAESIDIAFSIGVIHHAENPPDVMAELYRILRPGGILAAWIYEKRNSYSRAERHKVREFTTNPKNFDWVWSFASLAPYLRDLRGDARFSDLDHVLGISASTNNQECILDTFDWLTCKYQYQYTNEEAEELARMAGFSQIKRGDVPVSFQAIK